MKMSKRSSLQIKKMSYDQIMVKNSILCMDFYFQMDTVQIEDSWCNKRKIRSSEQEKLFDWGGQETKDFFFPTLEALTSLQSIVL